MALKWHFNQIRPGNRVREPVNDEFFTTDATDNPGEALVREGIQNSLDAAHNNQTVLVRIFLSGTQQAITPQNMSKFTGGIWAHLEALKNQSDKFRDVPDSNDICPFLVFEDFGTTGLIGDPLQPYPSRSGEKNAFYHFFRHEGRSDKGEHDRGRWGIGKQVFPRSSRIRTVYGLTVRTDDQRCLLMGQSVLRSHWVDEHFYQDGWFGEMAYDELIAPTQNPEIIAEFRRMFDLQRSETDSGLSLVLPWYDSEISEDWIVKAVLRHYFYPILTGKLQVIVETPSIQAVLDAKNLIHEVNRIGGDFLKELNPLLELAEWAKNQQPADFITLNVPPPTSAPKWSSDLLPDAAIKQLQDAYTKGDRIAIRVPIVVQKKDAVAQQSSFEIFLVRGGNEEKGYPIFVREGIIISGIRPSRTRGILSLVVVSKGPLATLLGDSENPAHTEWQREGSNFKGKYAYGPSYLTFVKQSVYEIVQILTKNAMEEDPALLIDFFSLPSFDEEGVRSKSLMKTDKPGSNTPSDPPEIPITPRSFRVHAISGGFTVTQGNAAIKLPMYLDISVAYQIRRGNAFKKYNLEDFEIGKSPICVEESGIKIVRKSENRIFASVQSNEFKLSVTGFDQHRDLRIKVLKVEEPNGD